MVNEPWPTAPIPEAQLPTIPELPTLQRPALAFAQDVTPGEAVLNWNRRHVLVFTGQRREPPHGGMELEARIKTSDGYVMSSWFQLHYPIVYDAAGIRLVLQQHEIALARQNGQRLEVAVDAAGNTTMVAAKAPRHWGGTDPRTGFREGTDAHLVGSILLEVGPPFPRDICVERIFKEILEPRGKTRGYAGNWYSYVRAKRPAIYGGGA